MGDQEKNEKIITSTGYTANEVKELIKQKVATVEGLSDEEREMQIKALSQIFIEGKSLGEAMGLPEGFTKLLYKQAYDLYNLGLYQDANGVFRVLCLTEPGSPRYILGLAATNHMMGKYEIAAGMYMASYSLKPDTPIPLFYMSDCFLHMNSPESSYYFLQLTARVCADRPEFQMLKTRCYMMMGQLRKNYGIGSEEDGKIEGVPEGQEDIFSQLQSEAEKDQKVDLGGLDEY